jgi:ABC-type glycerol-3-phosphate transport system substrate-binding protein
VWIGGGDAVTRWHQAPIRRREFMILGASAIGGTVLAACSQGSSSTAPSSATSAAASPSAPVASSSPASLEPITMGWFTVIEQYHAAWKGRNEAIKQFKDMHPNVTITPEIVPFDQWHTQTLQRALAGEAPAIVENGQLTAELVAANTLVETDSYIARDGLKKDDYWPALWQIIEFRGKTYGLPTSLDTRFTFVNKKLLTDIGASAPPATWAELEALAKPAKEKGINAIALYFNPEIVGMFNQGSAFMFTNEASSLKLNDDGTATATVNSQAMIETVEFFQRLLASGGIPASNPTDGYEVVDGSFINSKVAMLPSGTWNVPRFDKEKTDGNMDFTPELAMLPKGKVDASTAGGISWYIFKTAKDPDIAWEFINFLDKDEIVNLGANSAFPGKKAALNVKYYKDDPRNTFIGSVAEVSHWPVPPVAGWLDVLPAVWRNVMLAISGQATAAAAMERGNQEVQKLLDDGHNKLVKQLGG